MYDPTPHSPNYGPNDPRHHDLVHDLDHAWDLPIPYALAGAPNGAQPRVEFTAKPLHPSFRRFLTDDVLERTVHFFSLLTGIPCGCGTCEDPACPMCPPRRPDTAGGAR